MSEEFNLEDFVQSEEEFSLVLDDEGAEETPPAGESDKDNNNDNTDNDNNDDNIEEETEEQTDEDTNEKENQKPPTQEPDKNTSSSKTNVYSSLVKGLSEEGVFKFAELDEDNKVDNFDDFADSLDKEIEARLQERLKELTPEQQFFAEKRKLGYNDDEIMNQLNTKQGLESISDDMLTAEDEKGEELRKNVLTQFYKSKGFSDSKIERDIKRIFNEGSDVDEAKDALSYIKTNVEEYEKQQDAQRQKTVEEQAKQREESLKNLREFSQKTKEIIPNTTIPKKLKDEIYNGMTKPVSTTDDGTPLDIVGDFLHKGDLQDRYKLSYLLKVTNGLKDFNKLSAAKGKSSAIKELEDSLKTSDISDFQKSGLDENFFADLANKDYEIAD